MMNLLNVKLRMKKYFSLLVVAFAFVNISCGSSTNKESDTETIKDENMNDSLKNNIPADTYATEKGDLKVTLVGHGSVMFEFDGKIIHVDPYSEVANYELLPKADLIILTHEHFDHLDVSAINSIKKADTRTILSQICYDSLKYGDVMNNGDQLDFNGISIKAVPAYNMINKRPSGEFYHPKGRGNGYVFTFGDKKVYIAGDTENIPEMKELKDSIYIAFMPKNLPYTMTDEMFIDASKNVNPTYLYPYHYSEFDEAKISNALSETDIKLQVRPMSNK